MRIYPRVKAPGLAPASPICAATTSRTFSLPGSCCANVVTRTGNPEMANGDERVAKAVLRRALRPRGRRQHEGLSRPNRHVVATHFDIDPVAIADAVVRALLHAEQIVGGDLRGEPFEDRLA